MHSATASALLSAMLLFAAGCDNNAPPVSVMTPSPDGPAFAGPDPTLTTDRTAYVAVSDSGPMHERQWHFAVIATLTNRSDQTLYIDRCDSSPMPGYGIVSDALSAYDPMYACSGGGFGISLSAHAIRIDTLPVIGPTSFDGHTGAGYGAVSGTIALRYALATCTDVESCHAGRIAVTSTPFSVNAVP